MGNHYFSKKTLIILVFIALFFFFANLFQGEIKNFTFQISSPIQSSLWKSGEKISNFFSEIFESEKKEEEINRLNKENKKLISEIAFLKEVEKENENLRKALGIGLAKNFKLSYAEIINKDICQNIITINKGKKDGISKNMPVVSSGKIIIGKIKNVFKNFSKVQLLTDKNMSFDIKIQSANEKKDISGIGKGDGKSKILISFIPKDKKITKGDLVVSSSLGDIFPNGFLIGKVTRIEKKDTETFQKIEASPAFQIKELENLFIITGQKK